MVVHGAAQLHAVRTGDAALARRLAQAWLLMGALDLFAVVGGRALPPPFLALGAAEAAVAAWALGLPRRAAKAPGFKG